jgi:MarR family transcriptional regulator, lower aerobic nicotinate degradation pathway regulator
MPLDPVDALVQLSFVVQRVIATVGAAHDLSVVQVRMLGILRDREPGMLELGVHLGLDKSSVTGLVSRAEKRGLVRRSASPHDGRVVLVSLTAAGREVTERGEAEIRDRVFALTEHLTARQRAELTMLVGTIVGDDSEPGEEEA